MHQGMNCRLLSQDSSYTILELSISSPFVFLLMISHFNEGFTEIFLRHHSWFWCDFFFLQPLTQRASLMD